MPTSTTLHSTWMRRHVNTEIRIYESSNPISGWNLPSKRTGNFIQLLGGGKFRAATQRSTNKRWCEPGSPFSLEGQIWDSRNNKWVPCSMTSGPGGYRFDRINDSAFGKAYDMPAVGLTSLSSNPSIPTDSRNEAVVKALNDLADGKANLGENLGTMGMTLRMLKNPVTFLAKGLRDCYNNKSLRPLIRESRRSLERKGPLNFAAERYLEYVYGYKPLMQDIHGLIEMAKERGELPLLLSGRGKAKRESSPNNMTHSWDPGQKTAMEYAVVGGKAKSTVRCKLFAQIDPEHQGLRSLNQLGLLNPFALAWELATFSFVVDWVLPIGPVLNALSAPAGLKFVNGSISNRVSVAVDGENYPNQYRNELSASPATCKLRYEGYTRDVISGWPKVGFWFDNDPFRGDRILKATALTIVNLRGLR